MKTLELALKAGRKRQSPVTRFIHHPTLETIPVYENFCFALALLRSKVMENMLEAKALIDKLIPFAVEGSFPYFLHEYPACHNKKLYPVLYFITRDFQTVVGDKLKRFLQKSCVEDPKTPEEWAEFLIMSQITGEKKPLPWDPKTLSFSGPQKQERGEPAVTLFDLFLGEWGGKFSSRVLQDHPSHLYASLIYPREEPLIFTSQENIVWKTWGESPTHSLMLQTSGTLHHDTITLPEVQDEMEVLYFLNYHPDNSILINGQKANTFQLGDTIQIGQEFHLSFTVEGEGQFWGHIYRGNRPGQLLKDKFDAHDWVIGLRTVKREKCSVRINLLRLS